MGKGWPRASRIRAASSTAATAWASTGVPSGEAYADMAVLRGDPSDGLPGVPGIGEKTAVQLLDTFGSLAGVLEALDRGDDRLKGARRTRLEEGREYLAAAPQVVDVARDAPVELDEAASPLVQ